MRKHKTNPQISISSINIDSKNTKIFISYSGKLSREYRYSFQDLVEGSLILPNSIPYPEIITHERVYNPYWWLKYRWLSHFNIYTDNPESSAPPADAMPSQAVSPGPHPDNRYSQTMARQKTIDRTINFYRKFIPIDVGSGFLLAISELIAESGETGLRLQLQVAVAARDSVKEKIKIWFETGYTWIFGKPV